MAKYHSVEEARGMTGLRLVVTAHVPGIWSEAAKGLFDTKKVPYRLAEQEVGGENRALQEWTAQTSGPVAIWNDERPRSTWLEQLYLAERLAPEPRLIPVGFEDRVRMFGLINEICSENGYGWNIRLVSLHRTLTSPAITDEMKAMSRRLAAKYGYAPECIPAAEAQMAAILGALRAQLADQRARGRRFLIGEGLSALDIYWATFAGSIDPLPPDLCPNLPDYMRASYTNPVLKEIAGPELFEHRDFIYRTHLRLPMDF
jgi:glutathione S-transferase